MTPCTCTTTGHCIPCEPQRRAALARFPSAVTGLQMERGSQAAEGKLSPVGNGLSAKGLAAALTSWNPAGESFDDLEADCHA